MFLLPFSAFFSDTYFTYLVHRAFTLGTQSFGGQSLSSRPSRRRVEGSCIGFWKSKANSTFCKVVKQKGEGKPTFSTRSFPLSLRPSPLPCGDQGSPPGPPMPCFVAQGFFPPVHRAFTGAQSFFPPVHRAFTPANKVLCNVNTSLFILIFWGREKVFFGHKKNILLGVGK